MLYLLLTCFTAADMLLLAADEQFNKVRHQLQMLPCPNTNRLDSHANLEKKNIIIKHHFHTLACP
jgi:hypothetical protein